MANKKVLGVAYTSPNKTFSPSTEVPNKIETPSYSDSGVGFENYSKTLVGNETYRLNKQEKYLYSSSYTFVGGGGLSYGVTTGLAAGTNLYITRLIIEVVKTNAAIIGINNGTNTTRFCTWHVAAGGEDLVDIKLDQPYLESTGVLTFSSSVNFAVGDILCWSIYGYTE